MKITLFNRKYAAEKLEKGREYVFYGKGEAIGFFKTVKNPVIEPVQNAAVFPVYPLSASVTQKMLRACVRSALDGFSSEINRHAPRGDMPDPNSLTSRTACSSNRTASATGSR